VGRRIAQQKSACNKTIPQIDNQVKELEDQSGPGQIKNF
jgi:hypothetical protein